MPLPNETPKTLRRVLCICSVCRRFRGENGVWEPNESPLPEDPGADLSHGLCPDCLSRLLPLRGSS